MKPWVVIIVLIHRDGTEKVMPLMDMDHMARFETMNEIYSMKNKHVLGGAEWIALNWDTYETTDIC